VLPWNLRQLISYFFALIIYSINLLKTAMKTFATGNAIVMKTMHLLTMIMKELQTMPYYFSNEIASKPFNRN
jgi:hypothetical protein